MRVASTTPRRRHAPAHLDAVADGDAFEAARRDAVVEGRLRADLDRAPEHDQPGIREIDALHRTFDFVVEDDARCRAVEAVLFDATFDAHDLADAQVGFGAGIVVERDGGARGHVAHAIDVHAAEARDGTRGRDDAAAIDTRSDAARAAPPPPPQAATRIATPTVIQRLIVMLACIIIVLRPSVPELQRPLRPTAGWPPAPRRPVVPHARSAIRRSVRGTPGLHAP